MPTTRRSRTEHNPKARVVPRSPLTRKDVTRGEYNGIITILNERAEPINALRAAVEALRHESDIQFRRTAQIQADLDQHKRGLGKMQRPAS